MASSGSSPTVPAPMAPKELKYGVAEAPVDRVTVYTTNRAEVTRTLRVTLDEKGLYDIVLEGLPPSADAESIRVNGTGLCTILHVSYRTEIKKSPESDSETTASESERLLETMAALQEKLEALHHKQERSTHMRRVIEQYTANVASPPVPASGAPLQPVGLSTLDDVVGYCRKAMEQADQERMDNAKEVKAVQKELSTVQAKLAEVGGHRRGDYNTLLRQAVTSIDASASGAVELEIRYIVDGARWTPLYDIRISTSDSAISCSYYANVTQTTGEDWENVRLSLSTAEPTVQGTPPTLTPVTVNWKTPPVIWARQQQSRMAKKAMRRGGGPRSESAAADEECEDLNEISFGAPQMMSFGAAPGGGGGGFGGAMASAAAAPPPPPQAQTATTGVSGGGGALGSVSYLVPQPATVKCDGARKKLTVGVLSLTAEVTHYIVPSKAAAAYLQAKATNDTDFMLLPSSDTSVFFDNAFVTKTDLNLVSPGESFQMFLGCDASVKVTYLPPRKSSKKSGVFSKSDHATFTHRTTVHNAKSVPVVVAMVDALPRSAQDAITVKMREPKQEEVTAFNYGDDENAVLAALELAAAQGAKAVKMFLNKDTNTLMWVLRIPAGQEMQVPFEYSIEWPSSKEIEVTS